MPQILVVEGHRLFREGLRGLLEREEDFSVAGEAAEAEEGVALARDLHPDAVLAGVPLAARLALGLREAGLSIPIVAAGVLQEDTLELPAGEGILGVVFSASGGSELAEALRAACRGESYIDPRAAGKLIARLSNGPLDALSPRERVVLYWLAQGYSNLEVASQTVLSEKTVKNHVSHILRKLGLRDRTQAAALAWRSGFARKEPPDAEARPRPEQGEDRDESL